jgi:DNA primase
MSIPPRYLDELRSRLTLSDIIGKRVRVTRAGREFKACCPFHKEKTPSFTINDDKHFYHCFGCGAHGDAINFVMQHDNLSFIDTVEMLSAEAGLVMPKPDPKAMQKAEKDKDLYALMEAACEWFQAQLLSSKNQDVRAYLNDRGLSDETLSVFRLGYAPADHQALRANLKGAGFSDSDIALAGLTKKSQKNEEPYVFFRDRVIFPVTDRRGRVIAFGGRVLPDHMRPPRQDGFKPPKYLNSPDTPLFDKSRSLYGEAQARQASAQGHTILVTEGYMDVIACYQAGFKGAVAPMGTALTEDQVLSLWKMSADEEKSPVLCFDGDNAGQNAAIRSCERILPLLKPGHSVRFAFLPRGEDPDSLIKGQGPAAFKKLLHAALPMGEFIWYTHMSGRSFETPEARAAVIKKINDQVSLIADRDVQSHYRQMVKNKVSEAFFAPAPRFSGQKFTGKKFGGQKGFSPLPMIKPKAPGSKDALIKQALVAAVINYPGIYDTIEESFADLAIEQRPVQRLSQALAQILTDTPSLDSAQLQTHLKDQGFQKEMDDILSENVYLHAAFVRPGGDSHAVAEIWAELFKSLKQKSFDREIKDGWKKAFDASNTEEEEKLKRMMQNKGVESL